MKRRVLTAVACLGLLGASGWLVTNPVGAIMDYKIECADGTSRTCSGTNCSGNDDTATQRGYCTCGTPGGTPDTKQCPARGGIAMVESDY